MTETQKTHENTTHHDGSHNYLDRLTNPSNTVLKIATTTPLSHRLTQRPQSRAIEAVRHVTKQQMSKSVAPRDEALAEIKKGRDVVCYLSVCSNGLRFLTTHDPLTKKPSYIDQTTSLRDEEHESPVSLGEGFRLDELICRGASLGVTTYAGKEYQTGTAHVRIDYSICAPSDQQPGSLNLTYEESVSSGDQLVGSFSGLALSSNSKVKTIILSGALNGDITLTVRLCNPNQDNEVTSFIFGDKFLQVSGVSQNLGESGEQARPGAKKQFEYGPKDERAQGLLASLLDSPDCTQKQLLIVETLDAIMANVMAKETVDIKEVLKFV